MHGAELADRLKLLEAAVARLIRTPGWGMALPDDVTIAEFVEKRDQEDADPDVVKAANDQVDASISKVLGLRSSRGDFTRTSADTVSRRIALLALLLALVALIVALA